MSFSSLSDIGGHFTWSLLFSSAESIPFIDWFCHWLNCIHVIDISLHTSAGLRRSDHTDSTALLFSAGVKILCSFFFSFVCSFPEFMGKFFIFYFLFFPVHRQFHFPLFRSQDDRLAAHASDHVERLRRFPAQCKLERVLLDLLLDHFPELALDSEEPIRRTDPVDSLVGSFVVVELHPVGYALPGLLEVRELRTVQEVLEYRLPEPLDLSERHRMVRLAPYVFHTILGEFHLKLRGAAPRRILPPIVGEHLLGNTVFRHRLPVDFEHVLGGLAREEPQSDDVSRMVVDEPDQI